MGILLYKEVEIIVVGSIVYLKIIFFLSVADDKTNIDFFMDFVRLVGEVLILKICPWDKI